MSTGRPAPADAARLILFHKQDTSARVRFLRHIGGGVSLPGPLPSLCEIVDEDEAPDLKVVAHPSLYLAQAERWLGLEPGALALEPEFRSWVELTGGPVPVYLGRFTSIDPPFAAAEAVGCAFITIMEGRDLRPVELELLRRAYQLVLGG